MRKRKEENLYFRSIYPVFTLQREWLVWMEGCEGRERMDEGNETEREGGGRREGGREWEELIDRWMEKRRWLAGCTEGRTNGRADHRTDGRTDVMLVRPSVGIIIYLFVCCCYHLLCLLYHRNPSVGTILS